MSAVGDTLHLVKRFLGAIRPGPPSPNDERWAEAQLSVGELALWHQMNNPDRRHAVAVARAVQEQLGPEATKPVMAAALLHDVGKVQCGYRTPARVLATMVWAVVPEERADAWLDRGFPHRGLAEYRLHPAIGERLLIAAGADPLTSSWAADHHKPAARWRVPLPIGEVLKACDDD